MPAFNSAAYAQRGRRVERPRPRCRGSSAARPSSRVRPRSRPRLRRPRRGCGSASAAVRGDARARSTSSRANRSRSRVRRSASPLSTSASIAARWRSSRASTASLSVTGSKPRATATNCARVRGSRPRSTAHAALLRTPGECLEHQERGQTDRALVGAVAFDVDLGEVDRDAPACWSATARTKRRISSALSPPGAAAGQPGTTARSAHVDVDVDVDLAPAVAGDLERAPTPWSAASFAVKGVARDDASPRVVRSRA